MKTFVLFSLAVIGISAASIYRTSTPKVNNIENTNCIIGEITQITNASTIMFSELLAPQPILDMLQPHLRSRTTTNTPRATTYKTESIIFVSGILTATDPVKTSAKALVDESISQDIAIKKITQILHKQRQCKLNGKTYDVYIGDLPLTKAKKFRELFNAETK